MNEYELLYVVSPRLTAEEVDATLERVQGLIESAGGEVLMSDNWGRRRLAYPIKHHFEGTYVLNHLTLPPERTAEFERALFINEDILRHLLTRGIIPDYQGPPDQEIVEARRPAPRAGMRRREDDDGESRDEGDSSARDSGEDAPNEEPARGTADGPADAPSAAEGEAGDAASEPSPATAPAE